MARCAWCGKQFKPLNSRQKYDSESCRVKASNARRKARSQVPSRRKSRIRIDSRKVTIPVGRKQSVNLQLSRGQFDTMMTESKDEALAHVASIFKRALDDPDTPANALTPIGKEYLDVISEIDDRAKKQRGPASSDVTSIDAPVDLEKL